MQVKSFGQISDDGSIELYYPDQFKARIKSHLKGRRVEFIIRVREDDYSDPQRAYYFGVICKETQKAYQSVGIIKSISDIDYMLRDLFLSYEKVDIDTGEITRHTHTLRKSETSVTTSMMKTYCEMCIIWVVTNLDWAIPFPNENFLPNDMTERQKYYEGVRKLNANKTI